MSSVDHKDKLASNMLYNMAAVFVANACLFIGNWAVIRCFGKTIHGDVIWIMSVSWVLCLVSDLGLAGNAGVRMIARCRAKAPRQLTSSVSLMFWVPMVIAVIMAAGLAVLYKPILQYKPVFSPVFVIFGVVWVLSWTLIRICQAVAVGFENLKDTLFMQPAGEVLKIITVVVCWCAGMEVRWLLWGWIASMCIASALSLWRVFKLKKRFNFSISIPRQNIGKVAGIVWNSFPYYLPMLGMMGLPFVAPLLADAFVQGTSKQVSAATSIMQVCLSWSLVTRLASLPISTTLLPRLAHINAEGGDTSQIATVVDQATRFMGLISVTMLTVYWIAGEGLLGWLYAPQYAASLGTLLWLVPAIGVDSYGMLLDQILMAGRHVRVVAIMEVLKYVLMVVGAWWLAPIYGTLGIAISIAAAMGITTVIKIAPSIRKLSTVGIYPFGATVICCVVVGVSGKFDSRWWILLPLLIAATLITRLLQPKEFVQWTKILLTAVSPRKSR